MADKIFVKGMYFEKPNEKTPKWIKGKISINVFEFSKFLEQYKNGGGYVNIDLKQSQGGKLYLELNTYQSKKKDNYDSNDDIQLDDINTESIEW